METNDVLLRKYMVEIADAGRDIFTNFCIHSHPVDHAEFQALFAEEQDAQAKAKLLYKEWIENWEHRWRRHRNRCKGRIARPMCELTPKQRAQEKILCSPIDPNLLKSPH